jgi:riboflavin synthase alpha subunit
MFTGIIAHLGKVKSLAMKGGNLHLQVEVSFAGKAETQ